MVKNHLMRLAAPKTWKIERKKTAFVTRPRPGAHAFQVGMPINLILKEVLALVSTSKETKHLLNEKKVLVNGKIVHDPRKLVGFMDILSISALDKHYRVSLSTKDYLTFVPISDTKNRVLRIKSKNTDKKNKQTLHLQDGSTMRSDLKCKVGDSVLLDEKNSIKELIPLKEGSIVMLTGGFHIGNIGKVKSFLNRGSVVLAEVESEGETFTTKKEFAFVLGKDKPLVQVI